MNTLKRPPSMRDYLVGELEPHERESMERSLLADDDLYEELLITEDELVDEYVLDRLSADQALRLREYLDRLPDGETKLAFATAMRNRVDPRAREDALAPGRGDGRRLFRLGAAAALLAAIGGAWVVHDWARLRQDAVSSRARLSAALDRQVELERALAARPTERDASAGPRSVLLLQPGTMRGAEKLPSIQRLDAGAVVEIQLDLASDDHDQYHAAILDADLAERLGFGDLRPEVEPERIRVRLFVAAGALPVGDYVVSLSGSTPAGDREPVARYAFRVTAN